MRTALTRISKGRYRHDGLRVDVEKTAMPDTPWQLSGPDLDGSGVVHARTLGDARAFLQEVEQALTPVPAVHTKARARERSAAEDALLVLHQYLFPERYADVPMYEWHSGTIEDVGQMLERALTGDPRAEIAAK